jgi:CO/xanthine dehydrogenase Mo-binding subunit
MKKRGKGIACMYYPMGSTGKANPGSAIIRINHDGTVTASIGTVDEGQGAVTVMSQIVAEVLGIDFKHIRLLTADTENTPYDHGTGANRSSYIVGNAIKEAAENAKEIIFQAASRKLDILDWRKLDCKDEMIFLKGFPDISISFADAAWYCERVLGRPIIASATFTPSVSALDPVTGFGKAFENHVFATQVAEVEVDTETGEIEVLKIAASHDCGVVLNELLAVGQIEGGISMGLGYALTEDYIERSNDGTLLSRSFTDYKIPTIKDMPKEVLVDIVQVPEPEGPFGAKGLGEPTNLPTAPAIINAIHDAVGVMITDLPATPEKILKALAEQK